MTKKKENPLPSGRPTAYTEAIGYAICEGLANGIPLTRICREESMPGVATVYRWLDSDPIFRDRYSRSREDQADTMADEIISIADTVMIGEKVTIEDDGKTKTVTGDMVERSRLRIDSRKWVASKLKPKKYGDRFTLSGDAENPLQVQHISSADELIKKIKGDGK